jgi:hypothetical protein
MRDIRRPDVVEGARRYFSTQLDRLNAAVMPGGAAERAERLAAVAQLWCELWEQAELYGLFGEARDLVIDACRTLPAEMTVRRNLIRSESGICMFDKGIRLPRKDDFRSLCGVAWLTDGAGLIGFCLVDVGDGPTDLNMLPASMFKFPLGTTFGGYMDATGETWAYAHGTEDGLPEPAGILFALFNFMEQRIVELEQPQPTRAERRRGQRQSIATPLDTIIRLRRKEYRNPNKPGESGRELTMRHLRRGHWAKRWIKDRHPMFDSSGPSPQVYTPWLFPTIVGDESLPLKPTGERLFSVER